MAFDLGPTVAVAPFTRLDRESENWRTAFSFITEHEPGALHRAIEPFARHRLDLVQLVSRPIPQTPWRFRFKRIVHSAAGRGSQSGGVACG